MSSAKSIRYRLLRKVSGALAGVEVKLIARKTPAEVLKHFGVQLPMGDRGYKTCSDCQEDTVVFIRALQSEHCMNCHWPQYVHVRSVPPPWDPNAAVVPTRVPAHLAVEVNEPVTGVIMPLREGERMRVTTVDNYLDVNGYLGG